MGRQRPNPLLASAFGQHGLVGVLLCALAGCQMSSSAYNVQGVRSFQQGNSAEALQKFQKAVAADPRNADAYYNLAAAYHHAARRSNDRQQLGRAEELYHQCLDVMPDHVDSHRGLATLLAESGRAEKAFVLLERWASRSPRIADAKIELGRLYEEYGDDRTAERYLTDALHIDDANSRAWAALGHLREKQGQYAQALSDYRRSQHANRSQPGLNERIARLQHYSSNTPPSGGIPSWQR